MTDRTIKVALLGAGTVGSQVAKSLIEDADVLAQRIGARPELIGIAVRSLDAERDYAADPSLYTTEAEPLIDAADVVIELTGGIEPARERILRALRGGKHVVSGNKALISSHGRELEDAAEASGVQFSYEAAVAGAIPILRPLRDSLAGDHVTRVLGIMNGTTNFILDQMTTTGASFDDALAEAQRLGYAEADPTADVEGYDAAAKAAIICSYAFYSDYHIDDVHTEGITGVTAEDVRAAAEDGYVIKSLAVAELHDGGLNVRVNPTLVPESHPLASVHDAYNALFVESRDAGELMFYGPGAGGAPTASAVLGDFVTLARGDVLGGVGVPAHNYAALAPTPLDHVVSQYTVALDVYDEVGVLASIAQAFAENGISIQTMKQTHREAGTGEDATESSLRLVTHRTQDAKLQATIDRLRAFSSVERIASVIRVES